MAPPGLAHVFYSDSGSTSAEVAIKMALGYFHNRGEPRDRIVVMEAGYHGDTIGTMSAGERGVFNAAYEALLFGVDRIAFPEAGLEQQTLDQFEKLCRSGRVATLLIEPLVLGAGGMRMYGPATLAGLKTIAERYQCLFIADEVMTGWGRTGTMFACEHAGITPDILCTSKGLTGGALPLAVTLCVGKVYEAHLSEDRRKTFFHSSSYAANPIACMAGVANLAVWQNEPVLERVHALETAQRLNLPASTTIRALPTSVSAARLPRSTLSGKETAIFRKQPRMRQLFRDRGILIRPLGNVLYLMPPYCMSDAELSLAYDAVDEVASIVWRMRDERCPFISHHRIWPCHTAPMCL